MKNRQRFLQVQSRSAAGRSNRIHRIIPPSDLPIRELVQIQFLQIVVPAQVLRVPENDNCTAQINANDLGHIGLHIGVAHIGTAVDGIQIRHHAGVVAVIIPSLGRINVETLQLPAQAL